MMKKIQSKRGISILFILMLAFAVASGQKAREEVSKEYKISKGYTLGIDNRYGGIEVLNWDKNEMSVKVIIETEALSQSKAESLLDRVTIDISEEKSAVYFETDIDFPKLSSNINIKVTYIVNAPVYMNVELEQSYGNIFIQDLSGSADIEVRYGNLDVNSLFRENAEGWNTLEIAYGNASLEEVSALSAEVNYGNLTIAKSNELSIESAYSKLSLGDVWNLDLESKYDKVTMEKLGGSASIEAAYTTQLSLGYISAEFTLIEADIAYGNLKGEFAPGSSFHIDAESAYGSISIPDGNYKKEKNGTKQSVYGSVGNSPKAEVNVSMKYGNLSFK